MCISLIWLPYAFLGLTIRYFQMLHRPLFFTFACTSTSRGPLNTERPSSLWEVDALTLKHLEIQPRQGAGLRRHPPSWPDQRAQPEWFLEQRGSALECLLLLCDRGTWIPKLKAPRSSSSHWPRHSTGGNKMFANTLALPSPSTRI